MQFCLVTKLCPTPLQPHDCNPPGSSVHEISQARTLEWGAIFSSRGSSRPKDQAHISRFADGLFYHWATREALEDYLVQFSSVAQSCPTLCHPLDYSTPGLPVDHQLLEFTQTHVRWVGDAIQPSHPLSSPSPPAFNLSQDQDLFQWVSSSHRVAKVLEFQFQYPMNTQDWSPLGWTGWISLQSKGLSRVFSNTIVQKHQFFGAQPSLWSNSHIYTWLLEKPQLWLYRPLLAK